MITYSQIQEYCNDLGYVDNTKFAKNGVQYIKIQRWSDKQGYHKTGEKNTVCKMKLPVVDNPTFDKVFSINVNFGRGVITKEEAVEQFKAIGVNAWITGRGIRHNIPARYDYDITMEQLKEAVDKGTKWEAVRENKKLERMINAL